MSHTRFCHLARLLVLLVASAVLGGVAAALCVVGTWDVVARPPVEAPPAPAPKPEHPSPETHLTQASSPTAPFRA